MVNNKKYREPALLALADGTVFSGTSIGIQGTTFGEVVFNTAMTGYQEILTDPSYAKQIVTLTYPHIGNVGVNPEDMESNKIWSSGLIIKELSPLVSNWRAKMSLEDFLWQHQTVAIADIDTRRLTKLLREKGAQNGCIITGSCSPETAIDIAKKCPSLVGQDLAKFVSTKQITIWPDSGSTQYHVVVYDFGVKHQILRLLAERSCHLTLVPAETPVSEVLALKPDGIFLSNGPGDPAACRYAISNIQALLEKEIPLFGICLGFQLLALACGAQTIKMKFGHHGANHPVQDLITQGVCITSQNHGFAVEESSLPNCLCVTHKSLFDGTLQGIKHKTKPAFAFQGHPEASPGPHDIVYLFDQFINLMNHSSYAKKN